MTDRSNIEPRQLAYLDQLKAEVADLVRRVHAHQDGTCTYPPGTCPGSAVLLYVASAGHGHDINLLAAALLVVDDRDRTIAELRAQLTGRAAA
ncbi:hypothetical protein [Micromonospora sp. NPDC004551]|uniref:hypothetical protein n=1 Tax=Micromonospora sp. NPDC004551 TaxID=3154284 RepID=UPI0033BA92ED